MPRQASKKECLKVFYRDGWLCRWCKRPVIFAPVMRLIVFELGFRLDFKWLRANRWLLVTAVAESLFCFWAIFGALVFFGFRPVLAAMVLLETYQSTVSTLVRCGSVFLAPSFSNGCNRTWPIWSSERSLRCATAAQR